MIEFWLMNERKMIVSQLHDESYDNNRPKSIKF